MPKKTAAPDLKVTAKNEPVDLAKGNDPGPFDDLEPDTATEPAAQSEDDLDLDTPVTEEDEPDTDIGKPFTPVMAMEAFEAAMAQYPNSCLKHMLAEWKSQQREARKFEERQRVRGDIP